MTYNTTMVDLATAKEIAITYIEAGIIPLLIAAPGVGKTTLAKVIADELGAKFHPIRLNNIAPEQVAGLQYIDRDAQHSINLPPHWLPNPDGSDGPVVVFIDEINQASDENRKAIMSALLERYLGNTKVADNCYFMAAGNSTEDGSNVYEFDRATADRFGTILVKTDVESWCNDYAAEHDVDLSIVAFLRIRPDAFEMSKELSTSDNIIGPSPRTWIAVDQFIKAATRRGLSEKAIAVGVMGKVGIEVGTAYMSMRTAALELKSIRDLISMKPKDRAQFTPKTLETLWVYCQGMIWYATTLDQMVQVFELLESFKEVEGVPFYEVRFTVAEMMLGRAQMHGIDTEKMFNQPRMVALMNKWRAEMKQIAGATPDGGQANDKGETVALADAA